MIVPSNRLLLWSGAVGVSCALLAIIGPTPAIAAVIVSLALVAIAILDAWKGLRLVQTVGIQLPPVSRMSKDREAKIEALITNATGAAKTVRVALSTPSQLVLREEVFTIALPQDAELSRFPFPCTPGQRGKYVIPTAHIETSSPLGFWATRKTVILQAEVRVYPNLLRERRTIAALFLKRGFLGLHAQRQLGKGRDFEKLREYVPGDSYDEIHWKATARRGLPITKVFQIERTQEVYLVLDASRLSARVPEPLTTSPGTPPPPAVSTLERFVTTTLLLGLAAEHQGDLFGLLTFSDKVDSFVRARNGKAHYSACRDTLYTLEPRIATPDFDEVCTFIRLRLRRRALIVFLTSLDDPVIAENFVRNVDLIRRQHLVLVNMVQPPALKPVFSDPNVSTVDDLYQHLGGHLLWKKMRELEKVLQRRGVKFSMLENERLTAELISQYLTVKQRQIL